MPATYQDLYMDTRRALKRAGVESAALEAREIVCCAANKNKEEFYRDNRLYTSPEIETRVRELLERRLRGEPVAYLVGEWEFMGLPLAVSSDVLIPRADTEVLAEQAVAYLKDCAEPARVLDLCCGSGCIGLAVASQLPACSAVRHFGTGAADHADECADESSAGPYGGFAGGCTAAAAVQF